MEDEYAREMLQNTIEKEKTFKFKRGDIAMGVQEGINKMYRRCQTQGIAAITFGNLEQPQVWNCWSM
jgi:hypothetical protein